MARPSVLELGHSGGLAGAPVSTARAAAPTSLLPGAQGGEKLDGGCEAGCQPPSFGWSGVGANPPSWAAGSHASLPAAPASLTPARPPVEVARLNGGSPSPALLQPSPFELRTAPAQSPPAPASLSLAPSAPAAAGCISSQDGPSGARGITGTLGVPSASSRQASQQSAAAAQQSRGLEPRSSLPAASASQQLFSTWQAAALQARAAAASGAVAASAAVGAPSSTTDASSVQISALGGASLSVAPAQSGPADLAGSYQPLSLMTQQHQEQARKHAVELSWPGGRGGVVPAGGRAAQAWAAPGGGRLLKQLSCF